MIAILLSGCNARPHTVLQRTPEKNCRKADQRNMKQSADEASWLAGVPTLRPSGHLQWLFATMWQSIVSCKITFQFSHDLPTLGWYSMFHSSSMVTSPCQHWTSCSPALHRKAATDKLVQKIIAHDSWLVHSNIKCQVHAWLAGWSCARNSLFLN